MFYMELIGTVKKLSENWVFLKILENFMNVDSFILEYLVIINKRQLLLSKCDIVFKFVGFYLSLQSVSPFVYSWG